MNLIVISCICVFAFVAIFAIPAYIIRKGLDIAFGCIGNIFVIVVAGVLLYVYITVAEVDICQIMWVGEYLC